MKFNFDWTIVTAGAPYVTISETALGFNLPSVALLNNAENVIVGYDQPGQFDFLDEVSDQTMVKITDMTGQEFCYTVDCVERSDSAQAEILIDDKADLTLFVRDAQLLEYIIVRCVMRN